jgi:cytochrome b subunit of formate dehydrogenase
MKNKLYILLLLLSTAVFAQQKQVVTSIDKKTNKIGAEFQLTLKTVVDTLSKVVFPNVKNIGALEVIQSYPVDTIKNNDRYELVKKYGLTQFDSGKYSIPSIKILINNKPFFSDSLRVEVSSIAVDTLKQKMYDIKPIAEVPSDKDWIWLLLLTLLLIAIGGAAIYWWLKKRQKKAIEEEIYKTPIEKATSLLNTLEKKELWQKGEIKSYYSELTDIARNYIEEAIEIPAMESTTSELIQGLRLASMKKKMGLSQETIENLEKVLKQADLVKFAKSKPLDFEITEDRKKIERSIITLDKAIPVIQETEDEMLLNEMQRQEQIKMQLRKKRKARIIRVVGFVIAVVFGLFMYFVTTKGFDYVKDNLIGHPTKELLEGEWVYSEYGNPAVRIETPKVLRRIDNSKVFPKEALAYFKEASSFVYGSLQGSFYIAVSTAKPKQASEYDLKSGLQGAVNGFGGQQVILNHADFETKEGIQGIKGYGSFVKTDPILKQTIKLYFDILIFKEDAGFQQVVILQQEGDRYANQVSDRIISSVELKKASEQ